MVGKFNESDHTRSWRHDRTGFLGKWKPLFAGEDPSLWSRVRSSMGEFWRLLKTTYVQWSQHDSFNSSIIIAYYAIFSLPGLLVIIINVAGYFYGTERITQQISTQIGAVMGGDTASDIESIVARASVAKGTVLASVLGISTLLFGATGVFYQLQQMLNKIWQVEPKAQTRQKILVLVRDRLFSFGLILAVGFLMLISLVISTALSAISNWVTSHLSEYLNVLFKGIDIMVSIGVITLLFAAIFKFLPDAKIRWKHVWPGAILTSVLFVFAKFALGLYFGKSDPASTYGAAGSIILIMLWVSYTGLILLYGAEFTHVYCNRQGEKAKPTAIAVPSAKHD